MGFIVCGLFVAGFQTLKLYIPVKNIVLEAKKLDKNNTEKTDDAGNKEILPIWELGNQVVTGFAENEGKFGKSYLLFVDDQPYNLSGFPARQFAEHAEELKTFEFTLALDEKYSEKFDRDYYLITGITKVKKKGAVKITDMTSSAKQ